MLGNEVWPVATHCDEWSVIASTVIAPGAFTVPVHPMPDPEHAMITNVYCTLAGHRVVRQSAQTL